MKKATLFLLIMLTACTAWGATSYTIDPQQTAVPATYYVSTDAGLWDKANVTFGLWSGVRMITFDNVTSEGIYIVLVPNDTPAKSAYSWYYVPPDTYKADVTGLLTITVFNNWTGAHNAQFDHLDADVSSVVSGGNTTLVMTPLDGSIEYGDPKTSSSEVTMYAGDTVELPYRIINADKTAFNLTGYTVKMGVKRNVTDSKYVIGASTTAARDITADVDSPATLGTGTISLAHADTTSLPPGRYVLDIKIYKDSSEVTAARLYLTIQSAVIR